jgi:hypothetical protein
MINGYGLGNTQGINAASNATAGSLNAQTNVPGGNGGANTGGGGGGGAHYNSNNFGGTGGSGAVIIRYTGSQRASGGTVVTYTTSSVTYTAHAFFSSGVFVLAYNIPNPAQNGGVGGPYGGGGGGAGGYGASGGVGGMGSALNPGGSSLTGGGGGGGTVTTVPASGGGGTGIYGQATNGSGGPVDNPGTGGSLFSVGGQPGLNGNGGQYGGGGSGAVAASVDPTKGNGAGGALLIVFSSTNYLYPNIMPVVANAINTASSTLAVTSTTTDKTLLIQFDDLVNSTSDMQYSSLATGNTVIYGNTDIQATKELQSSAVLAGNTQIVTYISDHEMMLKNNDPTQPAAYNVPGNYQVIQEVTPANDPRLINVRLKNFVIGVTGESGDNTTVVTGSQIWY